MSLTLRMSMAAALVLSSACNQDDPPGDTPGGGGGMTSEEDFLLPWAQGYSWTYKVTEDGEESTKVTTIFGLEPVMGNGPNQDEMAFKTVTSKGERDETISWQVRVGDRVLRYREQAFRASDGQVAVEEHWDPAKLHIDGSAGRVVEGASWVEEYEETKTRNGVETSARRRDVWSVKAVNEAVTVPAGTFPNAVRFEKVSTDTKTYWYAPGVGKVKETGGQTEELVAYKVTS
jgi:hypothetical protein